MQLKVLSLINIRSLGFGSLKTISIPFYRQVLLSAKYRCYSELTCEAVQIDLELFFKMKLLRKVCPYPIPFLLYLFRSLTFAMEWMIYSVMTITHFQKDINGYLAFFYLSHFYLYNHKQCPDILPHAVLYSQSLHSIRILSCRLYLDLLLVCHHSLDLRTVFRTFYAPMLFISIRVVAVMLLTMVKP